MYQYEKHFTLKEALTYLNRLEYDLRELGRLKAELDKNGFNIYTRKYRTGFNPDTMNEFPDDFMQLVEIIKSLTDDGIILKGIEEGLIDFPAVRENGEEVFLCWKSGEEHIQFWHSLDGGFRGRRPISEF
jgi:hypothetical protein